MLDSLISTIYLHLQILIELFSVKIRLKKNRVVTEDTLLLNPINRVQSWLKLIGIFLTFFHKALHKQHRFFPSPPIIMGCSLLLSEINFVNEGAGELREDFLMDPKVLKRIASGKYTMYELANLCFQ